MNRFDSEGNNQIIIVQDKTSFKEAGFDIFFPLFPCFKVSISVFSLHGFL